MFRVLIIFNVRWRNIAWVVAGETLGTIKGCDLRCVQGQQKSDQSFASGDAAVAKRKKILPEIYC